MVILSVPTFHQVLGLHLPFHFLHTNHYYYLELGFSKEHRDLNVKRIGYVASEITKARGAAVCAPIAPYEASRRHVRRLIEQYGGFVEVYVSTPIEVCEARDKKGLYAKARSGQLKNFTGIDDPYEAPSSSDLVIDTSVVPVKDAVQQILTYLRDQGFLV
jgi:sulfate adenylyltransferase